MEINQLSSQVLTLQTEIQQLKSSISPCFVLINEILEARKKRNLTENNSHSLLSLLVLEIKTEMLKEISPMYVSSNEYYIFKGDTEANCQNIGDDYNDLRQKLFNNELELRQQADLLNKLKINNKEITDRMDEAKTKLDECRGQLETKATSTNLQELRQLIKNCATISALELLKHRVNECASKYQLDDIQKTQINFNKKLKKFTKSKLLKESLENFKDEIHVLLSQEYLSKENFNLEKNGFLHKISDEDERLNEFGNKIDRVEALLAKKIENIKKALDSAPWSGNITEIHNSLLEKATYGDLHKYKLEVGDKLSISNQAINEFKQNIQVFEGILARFDEILLIKAEKDDITRVESYTKLLLERSEFEEITRPLTVSTENIQDAIKKIIKSADIMDAHLHVVSTKCNNVIKDNIDITLLAKNLSELKGDINRKANKEDIYEIYDLMSRKSELLPISESTALFKKQLELSVVLIQSLCRTLIKNGENSFTVQKKREELLSSLNSLAN